MYKRLFFWLRQSSSHNVRSFVRPDQVCLEQSIFTLLGQRAIRALESSQSIKIRVNTVGAYKYFVLFSIKRKISCIYFYIHFSFILGKRNLSILFTIDGVFDAEAASWSWLSSHLQMRVLTSSSVGSLEMGKNIKTFR